MNMFENITVVAIHGANGIERQIPALLKTANGLPGSKRLLITNQIINSNIPQKIVHQGLDYGGYSDFVIYCLFQYVETEFVLIVQDDGWMLNSQNWRDEWFEYDYIGGLTHAAMLDNKFYRNYSWRSIHEPMVVQNGGFSLRSRKLLEAPTKFGIVKHPQIGELANEDVQLCCFMRASLELVGLKFATNEEAKLFSFEHLDGMVHKNLNLNHVFGHHSKHRKLISDNVVNWKMPHNSFDEDSENKIRELFLAYKYHINYLDNL
jgi:hypothetical protein